jgi:alkane 1-monooxygenase
VYENYAILSILGTILFMTAIYVIFGLQPLLFHCITASGSVIYLEAINYIEHYGLSRKLLKNGEYEKTTILHSWNAPHRFSNYLFFKFLYSKLY